MDWNAAIDKNREALMRILATLVGMAALAGDRTSLPRHLHSAVLNLLRPAEAAARRLIIAAARGLVAALPPVRSRKQKPDAAEPIRYSLGAVVAMLRAGLWRTAAIGAVRPRGFSLPLLDPLRAPSRVHRRPVHAAPCVSVFGFDTPFRLLPASRSPDDPIGAARLAKRLDALASALGDLPGQAERFARWRARADVALAQNVAVARNKEAGGAAAQDKGAGGMAAQDKKPRGAVRVHRARPLKAGRSPGWQQKPTHGVHEVLDVMHGPAFPAPESPDTS